MASVKVAPKTPFVFENSSSKPRDDSFSNYLALVRESFPPELGNSASDQLSCQISLNRRRTLDGEIEIFDAEKYFSGVMDSAAQQALPEHSVLATPKSKPKETQVVRVMRSRSRTGSTSSEASCNSRSTLLRDHHRKHAMIANAQRNAGANSKRFLGVFPCSCARKNAINVDQEALADARSDILMRKRQPHGAGSHDVENLVSELRLKRISANLKQEAFAFSPNFVAAGKEFKQEEKLVSANFLPKGDMISTQRKSFLSSGKLLGDGGREDDIRSEASSDLFEIESLSMTNSHPFIACEGSESMTTTGYEPSEASVEWSVVTASVANFSIASESDEKITASLGRKARRSSGSGLLLGCVSEKAVNVTAGTAMKMYDQRKSVDRRECAGLDGSVTPTARYRVESCGVELSSERVAGRVLPPSPFGSSRSSQE
ncbi:hypothetical protein Cni_G18161 [Canna indica]|uniref:Phytochrome kinase substrate 1 n=1 Tax=Canna indica TaxID=4628 RepID=A0AAQ3KIC3_9LILI|nr:hypothetical protein Cni_G18161 [Canna indica]